MASRALNLVTRQAVTARFIAVSVVVGALVGLAAATLILTMAWVGDVVGLVPVGDAGPWLPFVLVPLGLVSAHEIARRFAPEASGDGVPETAAALQVRAGLLPTRGVAIKWLATVFTVGLGGSAGREGPVVQIGGTIGSSVGRHAGLGEDGVRSLVVAGAGAAIGASFNAPIAGMLFALEVLLGSFAIRHLNAVVVASVTAAVTSRTLVGSERILSAFAFQLSDARELLLYAALGLLAAAVGVGFLRAVDLMEELELRRIPGWLRAAAAGLLVAALAVAAPEVLGDGQEFVSELVRPVEGEMRVWWALGGLAVVKVLATALTLGARGSGGAFMPSLFIGASLGAGFGQLIEPVWGFSVVRPGAFAVVGMAAAFASIARAPLTAILIVFEITGDYGLVLPLMLATSLATFVADRMHPESVYTMALSRQGIQLLRPAEVDILDTITVGEVATAKPLLIGPDDTTAAAQGVMDRYRSHGLVVVDEADQLVGVLAITDVIRAGGASDQVTVGSAMTPKPVTVHPDVPVSTALARMAALGVGRLPVVAADETTRVVSVFRREDAVTAYHRALASRTEYEHSRQRLGARVHPGADFFDVIVPVGSVADGRKVKQIPWPAGCTVVSIRRGSSVEVPNGDTVVEGGDELTVYGSTGGRERLEARLHRDDHRGASG